MLCSQVGGAVDTQGVYLPPSLPLPPQTPGFARREQETVQKSSDQQRGGHYDLVLGLVESVVHL